MKQPKPKAPRGRPVEYAMPEPLPDTVESVFKAVFSGPPIMACDYLKDGTRAVRKTRFGMI